MEDSGYIAAELMPQTMQANLTGLVPTRSPRAAAAPAEETSQSQRGFGGSGQSKSRRKGGKSAALR